MLKNKKVRIKKLIELDARISGLDEDYENSERVSKLVYEDDRRKLVEEKNRIENRRNRASILFVSAIVLVFGLMFFLGYQDSKASIIDAKLYKEISNE